MSSDSVTESLVFREKVIIITRIMSVAVVAKLDNIQAIFKLFQCITEVACFIVIGM